MKHILTLLFLLLITTHGHASEAKLRALYGRLDPKSVAQNLAFYELHPTSDEGKQALQRAWKLLSNNSQTAPGNFEAASFPQEATAIVSIINKQPDAELPSLSDATLALINQLASSLANRKLKGYGITTEAALLSLQPTEIDLARGLFLSQLGDQPDAINKCRNYEAMIDLMALQIRARLDPGAAPEQKIRAMNTFVFEEMGFRFPPHSEYAADIDVYTFLPSVLDSRRGVCLGVSILYICLAQRLELPLEMITPPGHIYVRYKQGTQEINIETTARGIHVDSEHYLGIETRSLQQRNIKEVIGLAHFNEASTFWTQKKYEQALQSYLKAQKYLPNDMLLKELLAYQYIFNDREKEGRALLAEVRDFIPEHGITPDSTAGDYLDGYVDAEGIQTVFDHVDETRDSLLKKKETLTVLVQKYPKFRQGVFSLAIIWLQLHRQKEALEVLEAYHKIEPNDPTAEYYLSMLHAMRMDYARAWEHYFMLEKILHNRNHYPKLLKQLKRELSKLSPI